MSAVYNLDYTKPSGTIKLYKYDVPLPKQPPLSEMVNFGLPQAEQKFQRTEVPKSIQQRKKSLTPEEYEFIRVEHHKRKNGVWILINAIPVYLTGPYYTYLNYWWTKNNVHPEFRYVQCLIFLFWDMVVRDKNCYGAKLVKPRRIGGTEFTLFLLWEYCTRVRNVKGGMQSKDDDTVKINFKRLTRGNKKIIWFMKPINKGSEDPEDKLEYRYPSTVTTSKGLKDLAEAGEEAETIYTETEIGSEIDYRASGDLKYDNEELNRVILNESGKLTNMSLIGWWDKVKPCLHLYDGVDIVGKAWLESTIEEIDDDQIEEVNLLCRESNPDVRDENGRTLSGLYLLFINYLDAAKHDDFGFPMREQSKLFHENKLSALRKQKKLKAIASLLRKEPEKLEDALTPSGEQSAFNREYLQDFLKRLDYPETYGYDTNPRTIRGNFSWSNGMVDGKVVFNPDNENGKFVASQLLKDGDDNGQMILNGLRIPLNVHRFRGGCDPYEHDEVVDKERASKGAGVIMRMYDDNEDGAKINEDGTAVDLGWEWMSKQPVCHYIAREDNPDDFFEDMLMMHVYYGTQMNVENNKTSIKKHFRRRGYSEYLMARPESTYDPNSRTDQKGIIGTPATTDVINQYFDAISTYIMTIGASCKHREIISELLEMNKKNRGKHDLGVSLGFALLACEKKYERFPGQEKYEDDSQQWFDYASIEYD